MLKSEKDAIRERMLARRAGMSPVEVAELSDEIRERLAPLPEFRDAGTVLAYVPIRNEVDVLPLVGRWIEEGRTVLIPLAGRIDGAPVLRWRRLSALEELGKPPTHRPATRAEEYVQPPWEAPVVVPGVAFTGAGDRLGFGGGHYDRFLKGHERMSVGVGYGFQVVDWLPLEGHDVRVGRVITEG